MKITKITNNTELKHTWDIEVPGEHQYLLGNGCVSHNTSGNIICATEGIEPIRKFSIVKEGTYNLPFLAPNLKNCRMYYDRAFDIPTTTILELAGIRQKFLDMSQSLNLYYKTTDSAAQIIADIIYAEKLGIKSLYYLNPEKADANKECESCSS